MICRSLRSVRRLREAAGLSQAQIAAALEARREAVGNWETGKTEPRPPKRAAYARLLEGLAQRFPRPASDAPGGCPDPAGGSGGVHRPRVRFRPGSRSDRRPRLQPYDRCPPRSPPASSRRPGAKKAAPANTPAGGARPAVRETARSSWSTPTPTGQWWRTAPAA
nr:helix-turn-helix domain-containing protein [Streptomyces clavuligerus]